jgi:two-component system, chemotaxis family, chemotaxis protein CheY
MDLSMAVVKILIADDKALMRDLLKHTIKSLESVDDIVIFEAINGEEAVDSYKANNPHISFLDINMEPMDGLSALKQIRSINPDAFQVIVSAENSVSNIKLAIKEGAAGFVVKPYSAKTVGDIMTKFFNYINYLNKD